MRFSVRFCVQACPCLSRTGFTSHDSATKPRKVSISLIAECPQLICDFLSNPRDVSWESIRAGLGKAYFVREIASKIALKVARVNGAQGCPLRTGSDLSWRARDPGRCGVWLGPTDLVRNPQTSVVGDVLAQSQLPVDLKIGKEQ